MFGGCEGEVDILKHVKTRDAEKRLAIADGHVPFGKLENSHDLELLSVLRIVGGRLVQILAHEAAAFHRQARSFLAIMGEKKGRRPLMPGNFLKAAGGIEGPIPRNVPEGGKCYRLIALFLGPVTRGVDKLTPKPLPTMRRVKGQLVDMRVLLKRGRKQEACRCAIHYSDENDPGARGCFDEVEVGRIMLRNFRQADFRKENG